MTKSIFQATETHTKEVEDLLPEEIQDMLSERALAEIKAANEVHFTPVEDAAKLEELITLTQGKINLLMRLDIAEALRTNLEAVAAIENGNGDTRPIALINSTVPPLQDILRMEAIVSSAISRYQKVLTDAMKQRRLLSGQMYGSRFSHSSQVSRMKRVRQITVSGEELLRGIEEKGAALTVGTEVEKIAAPQANVYELFTTPTTNAIPNFDPLPDKLPYEAAIDAQTRPVQQKPPEKPKATDLYCSSYEDD